MAGAEELSARAAAARLADAFTGALGPATRSVILHGSLSAGGFRAGRSDIDPLAVVDVGLAEAPAAAAIEHAALMVLTACPIWRFAVEHRHCSKTEAAEWALRRDPSLSAIRQALHQYGRSRAGVVDARGTADLLDTVLREIAGAR